MLIPALSACRPKNNVDAFFVTPCLKVRAWKLTGEDAALVRWKSPKTDTDFASSIGLAENMNEDQLLPADAHRVATLIDSLAIGSVDASGAGGATGCVDEADKNAILRGLLWLGRGR